MVESNHILVYFLEHFVGEGHVFATANNKLLHAVRALSDQVGALQIEQKALRGIVGKQGGGSPHKYMSSTTTSQDTPQDAEE